ncbi:2-ketogluconate transporter [Sporolactobacillus inulinus]|uniref:2-ketogluconate transporter n=1 Tax=Sporolactobacillus inulinus TaxID=2078 RepID=A0A4Y1ZCB1_9BACL|nr:2-ketogluconate transporter [Sporolactobacillus inulinus]
MKSNGLSPTRWARLIPIVFITYSLAYLDRANYSFGAASGMAADLKITAAVSSLLGALFFLGYFFFQVPSANYAEKRSAKKLVFWSLIVWGILASLIGVVTNIYMLLAIRFLLGIVEAAVMPAMLVFLSHWFTGEERSRANTFLILGNPITVLWMSVVSGYLLNSFGWRWMFIIEGLPSILWAFIWWKLVDDKPSEAKWLKDHEKQALNQALEDEQKKLKSVANYRAAFKQKSVIFLCLQYFFGVLVSTVLSCGCRRSLNQRPTSASLKPAGSHLHLIYWQPCSWSLPPFFLIVCRCENHLFGHSCS